MMDYLNLNNTIDFEIELTGQQRSLVDRLFNTYDNCDDEERGQAGQPTRKAMTSVKVVTETATPEAIVVMITNNTLES